MTIDELARETGMTVRNIRAHQSRGLLPPPEVRARTGYYGPEHVARIELIKELQAEGFNLEAIRRLLENAGGSSVEVLRFTRAARESFEVEEPEVVTIEELSERVGGVNDPRLLRRAEKLGLLRPLGDGRYEQPSPRLARAGAELTALGVPPEQTLDVAAGLRRHSQAVADSFVRLFLDTVWDPFLAAGQPDDEWPAVLEALERLRPLAAESLVSVFQLAMTERIDQALGDELQRLGRSSRGSGDPAPGGRRRSGKRRRG